MKEYLKKVIHEDWHDDLLPYLSGEEGKILFNNIKFHKSLHENVFPDSSDCFKAFKLTPKKEAKVVILGQDPYTTKGYATGLAFGIPKHKVIGFTVAGSLFNIREAVKNNMNIKRAEERNFYREFDNSLVSWAEQGVLLLNTALTVNEKMPKSHLNIWKDFTNLVLLSLQNEPRVYVLWGKEVEKYETLLKNEGNCILKAVHPSYCNGALFTEITHFNDINGWLEANNKKPIEWSKI